MPEADWRWQIGEENPASSKSNWEIGDCKWEFGRQNKKQTSAGAQGEEPRDDDEQGVEDSGGEVDLRAACEPGDAGQHQSEQPAGDKPAEVGDDVGLRIHANHHEYQHPGQQTAGALKMEGRRRRRATDN